MNRAILFAAIIIAPCFSLHAQKGKDTLKGKAAADMMKELTKQMGFDSAYFLKQSALQACSCIDSIYKVVDDKKAMMDGFASCIDLQVNVYELMVQTFRSLENSSPDKKIIVELSNKKSDKYKETYYEIERWLKDSCSILNRAISSNDEAGEKSFSKNEDAMKAYYKGVEYLKKEVYEECIPWFDKAVKLDKEFAFAWDNLGLSYRKTGKYDKAEAAYKASLKADPKGKTALQNLAVVYQYQKRIDDAIAAYGQLLKYYPEETEVFYGLAIIYYEYKKDYELALDNACKAYNLYLKEKSPYRSDAEKVIQMIYAEMKKANKIDVFEKILKDNNIRSN
jgi:tetratricopeptide (TPR) repeat protein